MLFHFITGTPGAAPDRLEQALVDVTLPLPPVSLLSMDRSITMLTFRVDGDIDDIYDDHVCVTRAYGCGQHRDVTSITM